MEIIDGNNENNFIGSSPVSIRSEIAVSFDATIISNLKKYNQNVKHVLKKY